VGEWFLYEDIPYIIDGYTPEERVRPLVAGCTCVVAQLRAHDIERKITASLEYKSQVRMNWDSPEDLRELMRARAAELGKGSFGERIWQWKAIAGG
jgi:hypothetical protein